MEKMNLTKDSEFVIAGQKQTIKEGKMNYEQIAKTAHEVNRVFCESIGDNSQPVWEDAPQWQKESAINGVKYHMENKDTTPEDSHINWMKEKLKDGWVYGEIKDPEKKTHPCLVDYSDLPKNQQTKDHLFIAVVKSFE